MTKIKNPCKFCRQPTNNKNGLQCQGACRKWMHFKCARFTPDEIADIRAGIIKVICPCPDCDTLTEEEPPKKCSNDQCPAAKTINYPSPSSSSNYGQPDECGSKDCSGGRKLKILGSFLGLRKSRSGTQRPSSSGTGRCSRNNQPKAPKIKARPIIICCGEHEPQTCIYKCLADCKAVSRPSSAENLSSGSRTSDPENFNIVKSLSDTQIPMIKKDNIENMMETLNDLRNTIGMLATQFKTNYGK